MTKDEAAATPAALAFEAPLARPEAPGAVERVAAGRPLKGRLRQDVGEP